MSTITESVEPFPNDVVASAPAAVWAVETGVWTELPDDVVALVATPLVVCAESR
ncbi:hypothetical protein GCM10009557_69450 [Virgisporangium ochraceum]|uniref:Uncharacterized protein n=1 Tax=Virgisporangium ochraceum TaxID=65505 RepID=A0A8J3ZYH1_9ACTN|nr:hypothetical protein [Virgisporangium ochraceum]GIJ71956.1 hypothetical protein Voc01_068730 [Virgisporangium ochraceum]